MNETKHDCPALKSMTRRDFVQLSGFAVGGVILARCVEVAAGVNVRDDSSAQAQRGACKVAPLPSHNPGFAGRSLGDRGILLWSNGFQKGFKGYHLNINAKNVWRLCDGRRSVQEICAEYVRQTHRSEKEAQVFLQELLSSAVVISGGEIRGSGDFKPRENAAFVLRLD